MPRAGYVQSGFATKWIDELHWTAVYRLGARWRQRASHCQLVCDFVTVVMFLYLNAGPWTSCSASCGGGHQFRAVQCMDRRTTSPTEGCDQLEKPRQRQRCANDPCSRSHHSQHSVQNEVKGTVKLCRNYDLPLIECIGMCLERQRACQDKLDSKLCASLKHMCGIYYFKVSKCCRTCRKYTGTQSRWPTNVL